MEDDSDSHTRWPACHRYHSSKLRCRRAPRQKACNRCIRANVVSSTKPRTTTSDPNTHALNVKLPLPPPKPLNSPGLDPVLQAMNDAPWTPLLNDSGLSHSPMDGLAYSDNFHIASEMAFGLPNTPDHLFADDRALNQIQLDLTRDGEEELLNQWPIRGTSRLDARLHELSRLNMALVNQQGTTVESIHALRTLSASSSSPSEKSPEREEEEEGKREQGHDCLNLEETLRIALQLLCILRQSGPVHDPATALLLLSCYSRLGAIFRDVFNCLQPILDQSGTSPWLLSRLFPHVQLGSVWLGDGGSSRLQAEMVLDASERFFADISTKMELFIDQSEDPPTPGKRGNSTPENRRSTIRDVLDEGIRTTHLT
ncbi:hypothetical protein VTI28DRAFT_7683 [Corynascus sepedonium]